MVKFTVVSMIVFASGCLLDHLTTGYGLSLPYISEMNPSVLFLIESGIWHVVEVLLISSGICSGYFTILSKSDGLIGASTIGLFSGGLFRLFAGLHNLNLIINTIP
jgi:hypothetical protein